MGGENLRKIDGVLSNLVNFGGNPVSNKAEKYEQLL